MVRTTKGPAEKSQPEKGGKSPADKETMSKPADIDDATWDRIQSLARNQQTTTDEVIRRAIVAQYGEAQPTGAYHSGMATDPTLAK